MNEWHAGDDVVIIGSRISGLTAAISAASRGLHPLVFEAANEWGGTSAMAAGGVWIPVNDLMAAQGASDSAEEALEYLQNVIGDAGPPSCLQRRRTYVKKAPQMSQLLASHGFQWRRIARWPDYPSDLPGAKLGRVLEGELFDLRRLGVAADTMRKPETLPPIPLRGDGITDVVIAARSVRGLKVGAQTVRRAAKGYLAHQRLVGLGQSLMGQTGPICQRLDIPVQRNAALRD